MKKNFTTFLLAVFALVPCTSLSASENISYTQLSLYAPGAAELGIQLPDPQGVVNINPGIDSRFPTSSHVIFNPSLTLRDRTDDPSGDFYPFAAGKTGDTDQDGNAINRGILSGMGSEDGHPSLFANGGDTKKLWERALKDYKALDFQIAYEDIGLICHLTQDQAVPAHAANINHVITFGDKFESAVKKNLSLFDKVKAKAEAMLMKDMQPYEYYQALQDDTRSHLEEWVNPQTGKMYWPPSADARAGQDSTRSSWSHYSDDKDTYDKNVSPQIIQTQTVKAAAYTEGVLKAAARLLPPVAGSLSALRTEDKNGAPVDFRLNIYDNRLGDVKIKIERPLYGLVWQEEASLYTSAQTVPSVTFSMQLPALANAVKGKDIIVVTLTDKDGNVSRSEVKVRYESPYDPSNYGG